MAHLHIFSGHTLACGIAWVLATVWIFSAVLVLTFGFVVLSHDRSVRLRQAVEGEA